MDWLAQIWERPDDKELLGVYADWLAGHGDPARAEYIQLALVAKPTPAQRKRRETLRKKHRGAWLGPARKYVWTWQESDETPGFVAVCQCSMPKLTAGLELVRALGPRLEVSISEPKAHREAVALAQKPLGTLYGIQLYENDQQWITDELLALFAPAMKGLRSLVLHPGEARSSDRGWKAIVENIDGLERLDLTPGENPERWIELLVAAPMAKTLRTITLPHWVDPKPLRKLDAEITYRRQRRMRYDRASGYYIP